jgi:hypothetical protein
MFATVVAAIVASSVGHAEVRLEGSPELIVLDVREATLGEVLDALTGKFDVRVRSPVSLNSRVNGSFTGALTSVVPRLLDSYNYVLSSRQAGGRSTLEIMWIGKKAPAQVIPSTTLRTSETSDQWLKLQKEGLNMKPR